MAPLRPTGDAGAADLPESDPDGAAWLRELACEGPVHEAAVRRLHELLLRVARAELARRAATWRPAGPELDDLAFQAAADATVAILSKLAEFRGESRFTTWALRFVILEVSSKLGRHFWNRPRAELDEEAWDRLPDRFGLDPAQETEWRDLMDAVRHAVDTALTPHQRRIFVAIVLNAVPLDALVIELGSNRNAIYKVMFDARRKLRTALAADGYLLIKGSSA